MNYEFSLPSISNDKSEIRRRVLLKNISNGNMDAFEEFYNEYAGKIFGYLRSRLEDEFFIRDIMQEVFLAVWKSSGQFAANSSVSTWIFGIARNKLMDRLRAKYKREDEILLIDDEDRQVEDDFTERVIDKISIQHLIDLLQPIQRELAYLVFMQGLSYKEVAKILDIPEGTVKSRVFKLKGQIRGKLEEGDWQYV